MKRIYTTLDDALTLAECVKKYLYYGYAAVSVLFFVALSVMIATTLNNPEHKEIILGGLAIGIIVIGMSFLYVQNTYPTSIMKFIYGAILMIVMSMTVIMTVYMMQILLPDAGAISSLHFLLIEKTLMFSSMFISGIGLNMVIDKGVYFIKIAKEHK